MTDVEIVALRDGSRVRVRPISPDDKAALERSYARLSEESRYRRFFSPRAECPNATSPT